MLQQLQMVFSSKFMLAFKRSVPKDTIKSHALMTRCGIVSQTGLGLYSWLPLGYRVLEKVERIISKHHDLMGFNKCCVPVLQPVDFWHESGRYSAYGAEMMKVIDRHERELILGPTAEEVFTDIVRQHAVSYKDLPVNLYNIQWKFRDEIRPRFGVVRSREFLMCDGYSFHEDKAAGEAFYREALVGYQNMFDELGFDAEPILQEDTGEIGGDMSHEFFSKTGHINNERIELGHIFLFGTKYSESMNLKVQGPSGRFCPYMGSYGVGVSRLVAAYAEIFGHERGISWPAKVAPFAVTLIGSSDPESLDACAKIHSIWPSEILYEDRDISFSEKLAISDLLGSPNVIIAGKKELADNQVLFNGSRIALDDLLNRFCEVLNR